MFSVTAIMLIFSSMSSLNLRTTEGCVIIQFCPYFSGLVTRYRLDYQPLSRLEKAAEIEPKHDIVAF